MASANSPTITPSFLMLHGQAAYWTAVRRHSTAYQGREQESLFLTMVAAIGKRAQEHNDTLQERDIHRFSTLKLLCQDRHADHHLLDNSSISTGIAPLI
jgi:hypothetical protein